VIGIWRLTADHLMNKPNSSRAITEPGETFSQDLPNIFEGPLIAEKMFQFFFKMVHSDILYISE